MDQAQPIKSRQEEAYEAVSGTFVKLLEGDNRISYEHKRSVIAFWEDLFAHEGVRNNMVQAFSNFLWEIDKHNEAARKAGIMMAVSRIELLADGQEEVSTAAIIKALEEMLKEESTPEEPTIKGEELENADLTEVGGGNEDDTSPL